MEYSRKLFLYSIDGITAFSTAPLAIASITGVVFCGVSILLLLYFFIKTLIWATRWRASRP